ncbi:MAG: TenA family transcriptional regulator [Nitrososphaerota archaeon]
MADIVKTLRKELRELNERILNHPAVLQPTEKVLRGFVENQLYIIPHDMRALSFILSRSREKDECSFFKILVDGDYEAFKALEELANELSIKFDYAKVSPRVVGYTHFLSWLALYGTPGDAAVAMVVNLPVWGENVKRLSAFAKSLGLKSIRLFELFAGPFDMLERSAEIIADRYKNLERYKFVARAIQQYELDFWDGLLQS